MAGEDYDECGCKIGRVAASYGLKNLNEELEQRWLGAGRPRESLRTLADSVNQRVLRAAMRAADVEILDGEVANTYRLLTDEEASPGDRTQAEGRLRREGIDVDAVRSAFISHQTVHTHLRECLNVSRADTQSETERLESAQQTIFSLQNRTKSVVADTITRLAGDELAVGEVDTIVSVHVTCEECGRRHEVGGFLNRGGCQCRLE